MKVKTILTCKGRGQIQAGILSRGVQVTRYVGKFNTQPLQDKADVAQWYTTVTGNPFVCQGSADTPERAVRDAIKRSQSQIKLIQQGIDRLTAVLQDDFPDDTIEITQVSSTHLRK